MHSLTSVGLNQFNNGVHLNDKVKLNEIRAFQLFANISICETTKAAALDTFGTEANNYNRQSWLVGSVLHRE